MFDMNQIDINLKLKVESPILLFSQNKNAELLAQVNSIY